MKTLLLLFSLVLIFMNVASGQNMTTSGDIIVDESTGNVTITASTSADYTTDYYYDLFLVTAVSVYPQGGAKYEQCTSNLWAGNQNITHTCSFGLGATNANLELFTYHTVSTTYYYYQIASFCTWECDYWGDAYSFSYLPAGNGDYAVYTGIGILVAITFKDAFTAPGGKSARRGCYFPTSESTLTYAWNGYFPFVGQFLQQLTGGNFNTRLVTEAFSGAPADHCWRASNGGGPLTNPDAGTWGVQVIRIMNSSGVGEPSFFQSNAWGLDNIGFYGTSGSTTLHNYVNNMRPTNGSCSIDFYQNMYMYCMGAQGPGGYYTGGPISIVISATPSSASITTGRHGVQQVRSYP